MLVFLSFIRVAPVVESALFPCARGISIEHSIADDGRIRIDNAIVWKSSACEYRGLYARAGRQDLEITFTGPRFASRPGGEFELTGVLIEKPREPVAVRVFLDVKHEWNPLWLSYSRLFEIDYSSR